MIRNFSGFEVSAKRLGGELRNVRIHRHGQELERDGRALLQGAQCVEQHVAVLAAAHGDHHLVALFDHGKSVIACAVSRMIRFVSFFCETLCLLRSLCLKPAASSRKNGLLSE